MKTVLGLLLCAIGLSACEATSRVWNGSNSTDVVMREDTGVMVSEPLTPELRRPNERALPDSYQVQNGVEIYSDFGAPLRAQSTADTTFDMMNVSGDPSVTIFPLDGPVGASVSGQAGSSFVDDSEFYAPSFQANKQAFAGSGVPMAQIFFKYGSSRLGTGDMQKISQVAQGAGMLPGRLSVEGHASHPTQSSDPVQSSILNLKESMNRAYAVSKALIQRGVPANKLKTTAYGDTKPSGDDAYQRRVDIIPSEY